METLQTFKAHINFVLFLAYVLKAKWFSQIGSYLVGNKGRRLRSFKEFIHLRMTGRDWYYRCTMQASFISSKDSFLARWLVDPILAFDALLSSFKRKSLNGLLLARKCWSYLVRPTMERRDTKVSEKRSFDDSADFSDL